MNALPELHPSLEDHACAALAQSRVVLPILRGVIAEHMFGDARAQALAIAGSIERRDIFQTCVSWDLGELIGQIDEEIAGATTKVTMWSDHDCDVTGNTWVETVWTPGALVLAAARIELIALRDAIDTVLDRRDLQQLLSGGRQPVSGSAAARS